MASTVPEDLNGFKIAADNHKTLVGQDSERGSMEVNLPSLWTTIQQKPSWRAGSLELREWDTILRPHMFRFFTKGLPDRWHRCCIIGRLLRYPGKCNICLVARHVSCQINKHGKMTATLPDMITDGVSPDNRSAFPSRSHGLGREAGYRISVSLLPGSRGAVVLLLSSRVPDQRFLLFFTSFVFSRSAHITCTNPAPIRFQYTY